MAERHGHCDYLEGITVKSMYSLITFNSFKLITGAGHHVYADKPKEFNEYAKYILELIDEHERSNQEYPNATNQSNNYSSNSMPD